MKEDRHWKALPRIEIARANDEGSPWPLVDVNDAKIRCTFR
jgi:hypothetical protein